MKEFSPGLQFRGVDVLVTFDNIDVDGEPILVRRNVFCGDLGISLRTEMPDRGRVFDEKREIVFGELGEEAGRLGSDGIPLTKVTVKESRFGEKLTGAIEIKNLGSSATPLPVTGVSRTPPAGEYLLPLLKLRDGVFVIAGLPRSPGYEAQTPERPVIYPWNDDVKKQIAK